MNIHVSELEAFLDTTFGNMCQRALMYGGTVEGVDAYAFALLSVWSGLVLKGPDLNGRYTGWRQSTYPEIPGPMVISQWFTDTVWGDPAIRGAEPSEVAAAVRIAEHYREFWTWLKAQGSFLDHADVPSV